MLKIILPICILMGKVLIKNYKKAFELYQKVANLGNSNAHNAQNNLAIMYKNGQAVNKDYRKAFELYQKAANVVFLKLLFL
jgi:TPR repeat protein